MNKIKLRKLLGVGALLGSVAIVTPVVLSTTSCATKTEWTITSVDQLNNYLMSHRVDVDDNYTFHKGIWEGDYDFVKRNTNLDFFVNAMLIAFFSRSFNNWESLYIKHIDNESVECKLESENEPRRAVGSQNEVSSKVTFTNAKHLEIEIHDDSRLDGGVLSDDSIDFDFGANFSNNHYVLIENSDEYNWGPQLVIKFFQTEKSQNEDFDFPLSPFDWKNKSVTVSEE